MKIASAPPESHALSLQLRADHSGALVFAKFGLAYLLMWAFNRVGLSAWASARFSLSPQTAQTLAHFLVIAALFGAYSLFRSWRRGWKMPRLVLERTSPCRLTGGIEMPEVGVKPSFAARLLAPLLLFMMSFMLASDVLNAPRPVRGAEVMLGMAALCGALGLYCLKSGSRTPLHLCSQGARVKGQLLPWNDIARVELQPRELLGEYTATQWSFFNASGHLIGRTGIAKMQCSQALENQIIRACAQALR